MRRDPIFITRLFLKNKVPHPLCPVENLRKYLLATSATVSHKIFVHPTNLTDLSIHKLRLFICKFIRQANPGSFPKPHDLRKFATSFAFFKGMNADELCDLVGWSSIKSF